jgi:uncharacterized damage-inducible protein DinB
MNTQNSSVGALNLLFEMNYKVLNKNLEGITHDQSLIQPEGGGNCLNWVLGHIIATRGFAAQMLKQEPVWSKEITSVYERGSKPLEDGSNAQPIKKLVADLEESQNRIVAGLATVADSELSAPSPDTKVADTVGEALFVLQFHEAYHAGQTGLLRRMAGHEGAIK